MNFEGVLGYVDRPSDKPPAGSRGHRVILPMAVAEKHLDELILAPLNFTEELGEHNIRGAQGVITDAYIRRAKKEIIVKGQLFKWQRPVQDLYLCAGASDLGMSYEMREVEVPDTNCLIWRITNFEFAGAAVLKRSRATYNKTSFTLVETILVERRIDCEI